MNTTLSDFQVIRPEFELDQEENLHWLAAIHTKASQDPATHASFLEQFLKIGTGEHKIRKRGASLTDFSHQDWDKMEVYPEAGFGKRGEVFDRVATDILTQFYPEERPLPAHLIHVTCTGYAAPSPAQKIVSQRQAGATTTVTHAYHMGCYASIPAIRMAVGFGGGDIVHTEICSLHLNPYLHRTEQLVVQTLFADGFIKYTAHSQERPGFKVVALKEEIIPNSLDEMHWVCKDWGLQMKLSRDVPVLITRALPSFVAKLMTSIKPGNDIYFAIHPGGPRIINQVAKILELKSSQFEHSLKVLQNYGNMSSATLPHVWQQLWDDPRVKNGSFIISLAFGPGLTLAGGLFQCHR